MIMVIVGEGLVLMKRSDNMMIDGNVCYVVGYIILDNV